MYMTEGKTNQICFCALPPPFELIETREHLQNTQRFSRSRIRRTQPTGHNSNTYRASAQGSPGRDLPRPTNSRRGRACPYSLCKNKPDLHWPGAAFLPSPITPAAYGGFPYLPSPILMGEGRGASTGPVTPWTIGNRVEMASWSCSCAFARWSRHCRASPVECLFHRASRLARLVELIAHLQIILTKGQCRRVGNM